MQNFRLIFLVSQNDIGGNTKFVANLAKEFKNRGVESEIYVPYFTHFYYTRKFRGKNNHLNLILWAKYVTRQIGALLFVSKFKWRGNLLITEKLKVKRYLFSPSKKVLANHDLIITSAHWEINQIIEIGIDMRKVIHVIHHLHSEHSSDLGIFLNDRLFTLVVSSSATAEKCRELGIKDFSVCNLGVDVEIFNPVQKAARKSSKNFSNLKIGFFYYNHPRKNPRLVESVIVKLINKCPNLSIEIFGNGFNIVNQNIFINENLNELEFANKLSDLDLFVYISRVEGFGLPPLEAMACGVPVFASNVGAINDFIEHNTNGLIIENGITSDKLVEDILRLINDPIKIQKLSRNAFLTAQNWTWAKTCDSYIQLFEGMRNEVI